MRKYKGWKVQAWSKAFTIDTYFHPVYGSINYYEWAHPAFLTECRFIWG